MYSRFCKKEIQKRVKTQKEAAMWRKKIKNRKLQYFMIFMILMLATAILSGCISFSLETNDFMNKYFDAKECPVIFSIQSSEEGIQKLRNSDEVKKYVDKVEQCNAKKIDSIFYRNDKKIDCDEVILYGLTDRTKLGYPVQVLDGEKKVAPSEDEIWICNIFADAVNLNVGDYFSFGTDENRKQYRISGIVTTPECSSGFLDNYICFMNEDTLKEVDSPSLYGVQLYSKDNNVEAKEVMDCFPKTFSASMVYAMTRETLKMCLNILITIFGAVGTIAALIIIGVALVIIRYLVKSTISKEYRMIGIYKTLGKTTKEIMSIYFVSYLIVCIVGTLAGVVFARPLSLLLDQILLGDGFEFANKTYVVGSICMIGIIFVVALNLWSILHKIGKITPLEALSVGQSSSKEKINRSLIKNAYHPVATAINQCVKNRKMTVLVILILSVSFYMNLMSTSTGWTLMHYAEQREIWENLPDYDGLIKINGENEVIDYIKNHDQVKDYVISDIAAVCNSMKIEGCDLTYESANPMVYENFTKERYKNVPYTKGRICLNPHEIACSEDFLKETKKKVGDYITISMEEKSIDFLITGSYSAKIKGGVSFYIQEADVRELGYDAELTTILFWLKDGITYDEFETTFENKFHNAIMYEDYSFIPKEGNTVMQIAIPICGVLVFAFIAISLLNIINLAYTQCRENRKRYGVQKAMGFSTRYIQCEFLARLGIETIIAIIIALALHELISPMLFSMACGINFIMKPIWLSALVIAIMCLLIFGITMVMLRIIRKISPVELMEE